jgi:hypothetical protein
MQPFIDPNSQPFLSAIQVLMSCFYKVSFKNIIMLIPSFFVFWGFSAKYFKTFLISFLHDTDVRMPTFVGNVASC